MKLFTLIASATAVIGALFLVPNSVEARNGWINLGEDSKGTTHFVKPLCGNWPYQMYMNNTSDGPSLKAEADCKNWRYRWVNADGSRDPWAEVMPQSWGEEKVKAACL